MKYLKRVFCFLFLYPMFLCADLKIQHQVDKVTGSIHVAFEDHVIQGAMPITISRGYFAGMKSLSKDPFWAALEEMGLFSHVHLYVKREDFVRPKGSGVYYAEIVEPGFGKLLFHEKQRPKGRVEMVYQCKETADSPSYFKVRRKMPRDIRYDPENHKIVLDREDKTAIITLADGGKRYYEEIERATTGGGYFDDISQWLGTCFRLRKEISSAGQVTLYHYDKNYLRVEKVSKDQGLVFTSVVLEYSNNKIVLTGSDGKVIRYQGTAKKNVPFLGSVQIEGSPTQRIEYDRDDHKGMYWLKSIYSGDRCELEIDFTLPKRKIVEKYPMQMPPEYGGKIVIAENRSILRYNKEESYKVKKLCAKGKEIATFRYKRGLTEERDVGGLLTKYFYEKGNYTKIERYDKNENLLCTEEYEWNNYKLEAKIYTNNKGILLREEFFFYDKYKRLAKYQIGDFRKLRTTSYRYNQNHLCITEFTKDLNIYFEYLKGTDLLASKRMGELEEHYIYDEDHLLLEKKVISNDFVKTEKYTRDPITKLMVEKDDGLQKVFYEYNEKNQLVKEFTESGSIEFGYDDSGRVVWKKFPLGATNEYEYDEHGNLVIVKEVGAPTKEIAYNDQDLPISCTINGRQSFHFYDDKGNLKEEITFKGVKTSYEYDALGRCITKVLPAVEIDGEMICPVWKYEYDAFGNVTKETSPLGNVTSSKYNFLNKPRSIFYADGSEEFHRYDHNGNITETILKDKSRIFFEYDAFGRCIKKKQGAREEYWKYDGVLLHSYIDQRGLVTFYNYDEYGRKISEECEGRKKFFSYDATGNICKVEDGDLTTLQEFDIEGRVIATSQNGFHQIQYEYNEEGKKVKAIKLTSQGEAEDFFSYDEEGNLARHISPVGDETLFIFDDWTRTEVDPLGNQKVETFDAMDRVIQTKKLSPMGEVLYSERVIYDLDGNIIKQVAQGQVVEFFYDQLGRLTRQVESGKKITSFKYDCKGRIIEKTMPNGNVFSYEYDLFDRQLVMKSFDGSIDYEYAYEGLDLVQIFDHAKGKSLKRSYSKFGELTKEQGVNGFETKWEYDGFGRKCAIYLVDGSSIHYEYEKGCMTAVSRRNKAGVEVYRHRYERFDENQHVVEESLPMGLGTARSVRDILELPTSLNSPFHKVGLEFNSNHLVTKMVNSLSGDRDYEYDELSQLTKEGEYKYSFDALGNSKEFEVNELNQIVSTDAEKFGYDANGNLVARKDVKYEYDALGRLISIEKVDGARVVFEYDAFSRLVAKSEDGERVCFLYDGNCEIGKTCKDGKILELKVLGLGVKGDVGAAIAMEFEGEIFVPLHDLQGNVLGLVDIRGTLREAYLMNAFGENKYPQSKYRNPWRFSSKRHICGLIYYGMRFYDPGLKRWLTPDPAGFVDGQNLYLFNLNSPINRLDQFGLYAEYSFNSDTYYNSVHCRCAVFAPKAFEDQINTRPNDFSYALESACRLSEGAINQIAFITYQNGINNTYEEFINMGEFLHKIFPDTPVIGIYNDSFTNSFPEMSLKREPGSDLSMAGIFWYNKVVRNTPDVSRVSVEHSRGHYTDSVYRLAHVFTGILDMLHEHAPNAQWLHIPHSEGGLVLNLTQELLPDKYQKQLRNNCFVFGVGTAERTNINHFKNAWNIYSSWDFVTGNLKRNVPGKYNVNMLQSKETSYWPFKDHAFQGATYGHFLKEELPERIKKNMGGLYKYATR